MYIQSLCKYNEQIRCNVNSEDLENKIRGWQILPISPKASFRQSTEGPLTVLR
jgi:hypothetical protein